jgi:hypothetical protein
MISGKIFRDAPIKRRPSESGAAAAKRQWKKPASVLDVKSRNSKMVIDPLRCRNSMMPSMAGQYALRVLSQHLEYCSKPSTWVSV